jgi:uncharacterized zinc-type alcohol dehydrogenase-like protein
MPTTFAWAAVDVSGHFAPTQIQRREPASSDVALTVDYCGICHSDVHTARSEWDNVHYPVVPGHEIVGRVTAVGSAVTRFNVGDRVAVGTLVDSCRTCAACRAGEENYCEQQVGTFNFPNPDQVTPYTFGGYSRQIVVTERFVFRLPDELDPAAAAPILCAGATVYSPMRHWRVGPGTRLGVAGFGGLGGMAVKIAKALGAEVTVLSRSVAKQAAAQAAGADRFVTTSDEAAMAAAADSLDLILSTVPRTHDINPYLNLLARDGTYVILGAMEPITTPVIGSTLAVKRVNIGGSLIGGVPETQELLDLCAARGIAADVKVIGVQQINDAHDHIASGDPAFRYVIDLNSI